MSVVRASASYGCALKNRARGYAASAGAGGDIPGANWCPVRGAGRGQAAASDRAALRTSALKATTCASLGQDSKERL